MKMVFLNWKMHPVDPARVAELVPKGCLSPQVVVFPPSVYLTLVKSLGHHTGAQNCDLGVLTGGLSPSMLSAVGCEYVLVGHSERRRRVGLESNAVVRNKVEAVLRAGLRCVLCVGETERGDINCVVRQLQAALIRTPDLTRVTVAYEPVWAVGGPASASVAYITTVIEQLRPYFSGNFLYGGSVNTQNISAILGIPGITGVLVGRASLCPRDTIKIIELAQGAN